MSYLVLARKYRPRTFTEVAGQQTAMRTLENALREDRLGHAYLFTGSRGTGKTTTARILAKALLCEKGPTPEPCGECGHCRDVEAGRHVDVTEIDAASNRGIDAVRELRDGVGYAPMRARYRIYIVDEVHQITKEGFNAFLKTLEEPPAHVKFFFATTELDKVIETVRSRCQIVRLSLISEDVIAAHLERVLAAEGVKPGPGVTAQLAKLARGSMRDALTLTDQLIALVGDAPQAADVQRVAPTSSEALALELWDAAERGDRAAVLRLLPSAEGGEVEICTALLEALRLALVCVLCGADAALFEADDERRQRLIERAKRLGAERTQLWLEELLHARERMALLPRQARIVLEVTLLDLARASHTLPLAELEQRLAGLAQRLAADVPMAPSRSAPTAGPAPRSPALPAGTSPREPSTPAGDGAPAPAPAASAPRPDGPVLVPAPRPARQPFASQRAPAKLAPHSAEWAAALEQLRRRDASLATALERCGGLHDVVGARASVRVNRPDESERQLFAAPGTQAALAAALSSAFGRTMEVVIDDPAQRPSGQSDAFTRKVAELFAGQIEESGR